MARLTDKQELFCQEYLTDLNATKAAIRSGYSEETARSIGSENLTKPDIQDRLAELMAARSANLEITQNYVLEMLKANLERAMQHTPVRDHDGNPTGEYRYEGSVANRAAELLGKHLGMFTDKIEHKGLVPLDISSEPAQSSEEWLSQARKSIGLQTSGGRA